MKKIALVCMPWYDLEFPAIQCEILRESLKNKNIDSDIIYGYLLWGEYILEENKENDYDMLSFMKEICFKYGYIGLGEWIFSETIIEEDNSDAYLEYVFKNISIREVIDSENTDFNCMIENIKRLKKISKKFIENLGDSIINSQYEIVGLSSTLNQNLASLALAKYIKNKQKDIKIIFGGSNCDSVQGKQLINSYKFIDFILSGEGEISLPMLVEEIINSSKDYSTIPGLYYRENEEIKEGSPEILSNLEEVPIPLYESYFKVLSTLQLEDYILPQILLETSRGCWWGEYSKCKFCGLNNKRIHYRYRKNFSLKNTILNYLERYPSCGNFVLVDNIIPNGYYKGVLEDLSTLDYDFSLFYEIRSNLNNERTSRLSNANVKMVQPGIESLETKILKIMGKGLKAIDNIQTLKMAEKYDLIVQWNILLGFIGEEREDYNVEKYESIVHFYPPASASRIFLERYSPYFASNEIIRKGNKKYYDFLYNLSKSEMENLAYIFDYKEVGVDDEFIDNIKDFCKNWKMKYPYSVLYFDKNEEGMYICDTRSGISKNYFYSEEWKYDIMQFIDEYKEISLIIEYAKEQLLIGEERLKSFLEELVLKKLCYVEENYYISLVLPFKRKYQKIYQELEVMNSEYIV